MSETEPGAYVVLGATGSVGSALARRLADAGVPLLMAARNESALVELADSMPGSVVTRVVEACQQGEIEACLEAAVERFGSIAGVANCVGSILLKPAHSTSYAEWDDVLATNLTTCFSVVRAAGKVMRKSGGSVVCVSSAAAGVGTPNHEAIAAAKAGVEGLIRSAAATYANRGLRFHAVAPGLVQSKLTEKLWRSETAAAQSSEMHPLGRLGEPDEIAAAIEWLLLPGNSWITGQVLNIDGGLANLLPRRTLRS